MPNKSQQRMAPVTEEGRNERVSQMSEAFRRLSKVAASLADGAEELKSLAPDVDRSVLSEDGLYNLMEDLDDLMRTFEALQDRFSADSDLESTQQED